VTSPSVTSGFDWVEGSPQAAENPPHDARWRSAIAGSVGRRVAGVVEVGLDFELEPHRTRIDLDNMVRLALDGLRDAGAIPRGLVGVEAIVATKRAGRVPGVGISLVWRQDPIVDDPFDGQADLVASAAWVPRDDAPAEKAAWRDEVVTAWGRSPVSKPVAVDIAVAKETSLAAMLKPVIDGLEPYLGREPLGRGDLRPRDEQVTWLRISRVPDLPVALRVRAASPPPPGVGRTVPRRPSLPEMDPDFMWSMSDLDAMDRERAWRRIFEG